VDRAFFITGGDRGSDHESWFIVVRDDEPSNYAVN
jgi:hypothetical protein